MLEQSRDFWRWFDTTQFLFYFILIFNFYNKQHINSYKLMKYMC